MLSVRGLRYHLRIWGKANDLPPLVLLHGWMDVSASWQFVVDALQHQRLIIAPDWRGFGLTQSVQDTYWFPDYLADLDSILQQMTGADTPVDMAGHSMGAHAALLYAAARPARVRKLVNMEGFGAPPAAPEEAPARYTRWLNELQDLRAGKMNLAGYADLPAVARRLMKTNPRLAPDKANWLAAHWSAQAADGRFYVLGEAGHKVINPTLFREAEVLACYRAITVPVLTLLAQDNRLDEWHPGKFTLADYEKRLEHISQHQLQRLPECGHMLHHDQPERVAQLMDGFLST